MKDHMRVLVAGIGGASLGTEIIKALRCAGKYEIFGCDISEFAFGHYQGGTVETFLIDRNNYIEDILGICQKMDIKAVIPGGEEPSILLGNALDEFFKRGIHVTSNTGDVISTCSHKGKLFDWLLQQGVPIPYSCSIKQMDELDRMPFPCVIKPATGSGGSSFVFLAGNKAEAQLYVGYLLNNHQIPIVQEYIPHEEGEFTIGVLHSPEGDLLGSIALKRMFNVKLSVMAKTDTGLISSGYSQGYIGDFHDICKQAELIAGLLNSQGPLNIQGRVRNGVLLPFEINPRFSASTYLRTKAGFNEVDTYLQSAINKVAVQTVPLRVGYYFRSLTEICVEEGKLVQ
ncbi:ATP-grasp domain-containing protein [Desulfobacula sp.]|uniref:ATP-grasp domain-containing protein n=1 Tax=Desulfobacula sp. TaxID=2593537 RepID=UPI00261BC9FE|nr:ATP-grasp domain-containing protein [Desulfobacula sp.]